MSEGYASRLEIDSTPGKVSGWALSSEGEEEFALHLVVGQTQIGSLARDRGRLDVAQAAERSAEPAGFAIDDHGLRAFARMSRIEELSIRTVRQNGEVENITLPEFQGELVRPLAYARGVHKQFRLVDIWFESHRHLALRLGEAGRQSRRLDAYQCRAGDKHLTAVVTDAEIHGSITIARARLINPYLPILLVVRRPDGAIEAVDLIPFPSLATHGAHAPERQILAGEGEDITGMIALSETLLEAALSDEQTIAARVGSIALDPAVHTGLEPMLEPDLLDWITNSLRITVRQPFAQENSKGLVEEQLSRLEVPQGGSGAFLTLEIPSDAIPTIHAMVRNHAVLGGSLPGSFAVLDEISGGVWNVGQPARASHFDQLRSTALPLFAPRLTADQDTGTEGLYDLPVPKWPLAIAKTAIRHRNWAEIPYELTADAELSSALDHVRSLSVVILASELEASPLPLIESLSRQQGIKVEDLIICRRGGRGCKTIKAALRLFPSVASNVIDVGSNNAVEQIDLVRTMLKGDAVAIFAPTVVLTDPRTLATMLTALATPDVATVGCMMRSGKKAGSAHAGLTLTGLDLRGTPTVAFSELDPAPLRQPCTIPVVANDLALLVLTRRWLHRLDLRAAFGSGASQSLNFGVSAIEAGGLNLCTTLVSAFNNTNEPLPGSGSYAASARVSAEGLERIARSATIVQKIR